MILKINPQFQNLLPNLSKEEFSSLKKSIETEGCREAIITWKGYIVDGHNRYKICTDLDIDFNTVEYEFADEEAVCDWIDQNQIARRNLSPIAFMLAVGRRYNRLKKSHGGDRKSNGQIDHLIDTVTSGKNDQMLTATVIAKEVGISERTVRRAGKLAEEIEASPKFQEAIKQNKPIKEVRRELKREAHAEAVESAKANPVVSDEGPYDLILADPPWRYDDCQTESRAIENNYDTATLEQIKSHKPNGADNSILFLWATAPKLVEAIEVMSAWGYKYRSNMCWDKVSIGMGYWSRGQHELLLIGTKGSPGCTPECARVSSIFVEKRTKHSVKPVCVYEWIERAFPTLSKLELYAREQRNGWSSVGNELGVTL
jgi:N6-adenosine-specific RNA methylase IME4/ParB-like chromosome segregation protein Spo0J